MDNKGTTTSYEGVLPSHMPFDIWEVYARLVLQFLDEATYRNLSHRDKPDLWDELHDLGVEVTQAISQETQEADALYAKLRETDDAKLKERLTERIEQVGAEVFDWGLFGPSGKDSFGLVIEAYKEKLGKLNGGGYRPFAHNHPVHHRRRLKERLPVVGPHLANGSLLPSHISHSDRRHLVKPGVNEHAIELVKPYFRHIIVGAHDDSWKAGKPKPRAKILNSTENHAQIWDPRFDRKALGELVVDKGKSLDFRQAKSLAGHVPKGQFEGRTDKRGIILRCTNPLDVVTRERHSHQPLPANLSRWRSNLLKPHNSELAMVLSKPVIQGFHTMP